MEVSKGVIADAGVVESRREWEKPGRLHVFGVNEGMESGMKCLKPSVRWKSG